MTARLSKTYRGARKRLAKQNKLVWREISRGQLSTASTPQRMQRVIADPRPRVLTDGARKWLEP